MRRVVLAVVVLLLSGGLAGASTIYVQTTPAGATALPGLVGATVETFGGVTEGRYTNLVLGGVTFTPGAGTALYISDSFSGTYNTWGNSLANTYAGDAFGTLSMTFAAPVSAIGFFWGASNDQWTLSVFDAGHSLLEAFALPITASSSAGDFVGIVHENIAYAVLSGVEGDYIFVDNFAFNAGGTTTVPEPASLLLLGAGLIGLGCAWRRRR